MAVAPSVAETAAPDPRKGRRSTRRARTEAATKAVTNATTNETTKATEALAKAPPAQPPPDAKGGGATDREAPAQLGYYSVDSRPYAAIFIDGKARGETPLFRIPLTAGQHQVRAVRADGTTKTFSITISDGKEVSSGQLKW